MTDDTIFGTPPTTLPEEYAWVRPGVRCWYHPIIGDLLRFAGVVREEPWQVSGGRFATHISQLGSDYWAWRGAEKTTAHSVLLEALERCDMGESVTKELPHADVAQRAQAQLDTARKALEDAKASLIAAEERFLYATGWTRHPTLKDNWQNVDTITHRANAVKIQANQKPA